LKQGFKPALMVACISIDGALASDPRGGLGGWRVRRDRIQSQWRLDDLPAVSRRTL